MTTPRANRIGWFFVPLMLSGCLLPVLPEREEDSADAAMMPKGASQPANGACSYRRESGGYCVFDTGSVSDTDSERGCSPAASAEHCRELTRGYSDSSGGCSFVVTYSGAEYEAGVTCSDVAGRPPATSPQPLSTMQQAASAPMAPASMPVATTPVVAVPSMPGDSSEGVRSGESAPMTPGAGNSPAASQPALPQASSADGAASVATTPVAPHPAVSGEPVVMPEWGGDAGAPVEAGRDYIDGQADEPAAEGDAGAR
jgi:hypothetical protein